MNKNLVLALGMAGILASCDAPTSETANEESSLEKVNEADHVLAEGASTWTTYEGSIPCASCSEIQMTLRIENKADKTEREYTLTEVYKGRQEGERTVESKGTYEVSYGIEGDQGAMLITLLDENGNPVNTFLQDKESNNFILLDKNNKIIKSDLNYTLTKK
ncbi:copper resistance protein NlpE N-terminal domain-containing protein [Echinicola sp. CAU 1574]|uniref:Copper resistance protein NlpE N-terminal domain-containing protein n=1 Tax=Echinicola arenosa TaxID=2774144 RepID=A0ABR9APU0_9BACT|nr:copper resistance protein NlpE N-terminal domain-containing protein [Echinicola arenosa]MBD8490356.1 copper resistance protein NlpE N-terminal domain-containing protein [Echinicola arenosa]